MDSLKDILAKSPILPSQNTEAPLPAGECWCRGTGERVKDWGVEYCVCPAGQDRKTKALKAREESNAKFAETRYRKSLNLPSRFLGLSLATSPLQKTMPGLMARLRGRSFPLFDDPEYVDGEEAKADRDAAEWRATFPGNWYFWGAYGTGKTGLVAAMAKQLIFSRELENAYGLPLYVRFITVPDLLTELRATYGGRRQRDGEEDGGPKTEADVLEFYQKPDVLILDDLGAEQIKGSGWVEDRLYQVIGHRHGETEKYTWFTSNLSIQQLGDRIGERIAWRIVEMCGMENIVEIKGANLRDQKSKL